MNLSIRRMSVDSSQTSYEGLRQRAALKPQRYAGAPSSSSAQVDHSSHEDQTDLLERMLEGSNLRLAVKQVKQNGGAPGVDGVTVETLQAHLWERWDEVRNQLLSGSYEPMPVRRVEIPKPGGGKRLLGIPTVMVRFLQQALLQVMTLRDPKRYPVYLLIRMEHGLFYLYLGGASILVCPLSCGSFHPLAYRKRAKRMQRLVGYKD
jgi:hypothetical protein